MLLTELSEINVMDVGTGALPMTKLNQILNMLYYQVPLIDRHCSPQNFCSPAFVSSPLPSAFSCHCYCSSFTFRCPHLSCV